MLKAIETTYKGYRFRSRLEARWAVFFDRLGVPWEYEKKGYDLGEAGWYLPDFWLPNVFDAGIWVEIKGKKPSVDECLKATALAKQGECIVILVWGTPGEEDGILFEHKTGIDLPFNNYPVWCDFFGCKHELRMLSDSCPRIKNAYISVRSARFEHGETPWT